MQKARTAHRQISAVSRGRSEPPLSCRVVQPHADVAHRRAIRERAAHFQDCSALVAALRTSIGGRCEMIVDQHQRDRKGDGFGSIQLIATAKRSCV
jgi:hypothetical protein